MGNTIWYVGGNKGGIGKSLWSTMLVDWLFKNRPSKKLLIIDTDLSGADVGERYQLGEFDGKYERITKRGLDLTVAEDDTGTLIEANWSALSNIIQAHSDHDVVINSAAAQISAIQQCGHWFGHIIEMTGCDFVTYWLIDRGDTCLHALGKFLDSVPNTVVHVVKNRREGRSDSFEALENAVKLRERISSRNGLVIEFPKLGLNLAANFQNSKIPFDETLASLKNMGDQVMFGRWKDSVWKQIEKTMG